MNCFSHTRKKNKENDLMRREFRKCFHLICSAVLCYKQNTTFSEKFSIKLFSEYYYLRFYMSANNFEKEMLRLAVFQMDQNLNEYEVNCSNILIQLRKIFSGEETLYLTLKYKFCKSNSFIRFVFNKDYRELVRFKKEISSKIREAKIPSFL